MRIAIVGAGMAGLSCGEALETAGHAVTSFDKGSRPGGRMSTRIVPTALGPASFDHGAQYFTARDPSFQSRVARWRAEGVVAPWPAAGTGAWTGVPGMSAPVAAMATHRDVRWDTRVDALTRHDDRWTLTGVDGSESFEAVIVAVPAEQVSDLVGPFDGAMAELAGTTRSEPCWTVMAAFSSRLATDADVMRRSGIPSGTETDTIGWAARDSSKPGRSGLEAWVIQAGPDWSKDHLEDAAETVSATLLAAFERQLNAPLPAPLAVVAHRWRYAKSGAAGAAGATHLWNATIKLGICGDWLIGPRIESAWMSGTALARAIEAR